MRYYYQKLDNYIVTKGHTYKCNHPLYDTCTLYLDGDFGLAVIQERFNSTLKTSWWSAIDPWLIDDIFNQPGFADYFNKNSEECRDGLYPTVTVRQIMWALRMKPLAKEAWELAKKT